MLAKILGRVALERRVRNHRIAGQSQVEPVRPSVRTCTLAVPWVARPNQRAQSGELSCRGPEAEVREAACKVVAGRRQGLGRAPRGMPYVLPDEPSGTGLSGFDELQNHKLLTGTRVLPLISRNTVERRYFRAWRGSPRLWGLFRRHRDRRSAHRDGSRAGGSSP